MKPILIRTGGQLETHAGLSCDVQAGFWEFIRLATAYKQYSFFNFISLAVTCPRGH